MAAQVTTGYSWGGATNSESPLTAKMLEKGRPMHRAIVSSPFFVKLLNKEANEISYGQYLVDLHHVYHALELAIKENNRLLSALNIEELFRENAIKQDLERFNSSSSQPTEAAKQYAQHLDYLGREKPWRLIAHAYARYLGDILGGYQLMLPKIEEKWGQGRATIYQFDTLLAKYQIQSIRQFDSIFKDTLNKIGMSQDYSKQQEIEEETVLAYEHSASMLKALEPLL